MEKFRVLLADDSSVVRLIVARQLQLLDITPDLCEDGLQAVNAYAANEYDLIFMDVMMPNLDGIEATKQIRAIELRERRRRTPIIGVTGYTDRASCIGAGMDDFLFKPVSTEQLRGALRSFLPESFAPNVSTVSNIFAESETPTTTQSELADLRISDLKRRLGFADMPAQHAVAE